MTQELIERQQAIVEALYNCGSKTEAMQYVSLIGEDLPNLDLPADCIIAGCLSRTYFRAYAGYDGIIRIDGCSQSVIMRGVIQIMRNCFRDAAIENVGTVGVTWVKDSGLLDMLTPQRQGAVLQMIERINKACNV